MPSTISPNMGLIVPGVGTEPGPQWATDLNSSLGTLDQHDHSSGSGVKVTPDGININTDLPINSNNLTSVLTVNFTNQLAALPGLSPNLGCIYVAGGEFYYNDEVGNVVQVTNGGSVNAGAGSITGLPSGTASASYSAGGQKFIWQSATSTAAGMDNGPVTIREQVPSANGVTIASPTSLAASYSMTFPAALPAGQRFLTLDNSGNIASDWNVDNSTIEVSSNLVQVKDGGITNPKLAPLGQIISDADGATHSTASTADIAADVTIVTTGRPVYIGLINQYFGTNECFINTDGIGQVIVHRDGSIIAQIQVRSCNPGTAAYWPPSSFFVMDIGATAGSHTYKIEANAPSGTVTWRNAGIIAYEM